jgi:hypothetical protein
MAPVSKTSNGSSRPLFPEPNFIIIFPFCTIRVVYHFSSLKEDGPIFISWDLELLESSS